MTTLATYVFPSGTALSGIVVRAYACGRYLNNSGGPLIPTLTTTVNGNVQCSEAVTVVASPIAQAFSVWAHFYFTTVVTAAGQQVSVGSNIEISLSNAYATATQTGAFVAQNLLQCLTNPYNTFLTTSLTTSLALVFNPIGTDVLEVHGGYMEAL